jgi:DNA-binding CsgD family transcriptional regulator
MLDFLFQALHAAADQLSAAFLICGADGRIYHANHAAKEMLEAHWPVRRHNQAYLRVSDRARHEVVLGGLRQLAADASLTDPCQLSLEIPLSSPRSSRGAAIATLSPLVLQEQRLIGVFVTVATRNCASEVSGFAACFGLTPAETRTLQQFMNGLSAIEAAAALKISYNTIKTHLRNIFAKTRTSRQPDLAMLFAGLRPPLRRYRDASLGESHPGLAARPHRDRFSSRLPAVALERQDY